MISRIKSRYFFGRAYLITARDDLFRRRDKKCSQFHRHKSVHILALSTMMCEMLTICSQIFKPLYLTRVEKWGILMVQSLALAHSKC